MILSIYQKEGISRIVAVWCKCTHNVLFLLCYPNNQPHLMLYRNHYNHTSNKRTQQKICLYILCSSNKLLLLLYICSGWRCFFHTPTLTYSHYHRLFMFILSLVFTMWCESNIVYIGKTWRPFTYNVIMY